MRVWLPDVSVRVCVKSSSRTIEAVLFSSSVQVGGPSPPFKGVAPPFYREAFHKEDKKWISLGLPFIRMRTKVWINLGSGNPSTACMVVPNTKVDNNISFSLSWCYIDIYFSG